MQTTVAINVHVECPLIGNSDRDRTTDRASWPDSDPMRRQPTEPTEPTEPIKPATPRSLRDLETHRQPRFQDSARCSRAWCGRAAAAPLGGSMFVGRSVKPSSAAGCACHRRWHQGRFPESNPVQCARIGARTDVATYGAGKLVVTPECTPEERIHGQRVASLFGEFEQTGRWVFC